MKKEVSAMMDIIETISILAGSVILLGLFLSTAYEDRRKGERRVSALNNKWQKLIVPAH